MPFPFTELCTLFSRLEDIELHDPPILNPAEKHTRDKTVVESWFKAHRAAIDRLEASEAIALLSALLPERRPDRVYGIQSATLCKILSRCLGLSASRSKDLQAYKRPGAGDLGVCLERVLKAGGPPAWPPVDLQDVDDVLVGLAENCYFSDPTVRPSTSSAEQRREALGNLVKRLQPVQGKWLVRLVLKDLSPLRLNETIVLKSFHFLLPDLLRFQNSFDAAMQHLRDSLKQFPSNPDPRSRDLHRQSAASLLKPAVGVKIGRPSFVKGRSIASCIKLCGRERWILERKYDGEFCEIHIDMNRSKDPRECITIFSKSGKRSTDDRKNLCETLVECFHLDRPTRKIRRQAIVLGEMAVYSDQAKRILPFEEIRKHVTRSGRFLGTDEDSQPQPGQHLAIVFFDVLLLDEEVLMNRPLEERRTRLRELYTKLPGRAMGAEWKIVDFGRARDARRTLIQQFAASIAERCEGLLLKPCTQPYFGFQQAENSGFNAYIKLKKDYIEGLGDEADFAVIGGGYSGQQALKRADVKLKWTVFYLGCVLNKVEVLRFDTRPRFKVVGSIQAEHCIPQPVLETANLLGHLCANTCVRGQQPVQFDVDGSPPAMTTIFNTPLVFEVLGSGFEKPSNCSFLMLRHPRVKKLHQDRDWKDCVSFQELQQQAVLARNVPVGGETQETLKMIHKLEAKCKKKSERESTGTPQSKSTRKHSISPRNVDGESTDGSPVLGRPVKERISVSSPAVVDLDGTTLINSSATAARKRVLDERQSSSPLPQAKKLRTSGNGSETTRPGDQITRSERASRALGDITNIAASSSPTRPRSQRHPELRANDMAPTTPLPRHSLSGQPGLSSSPSPTTSDKPAHCANSTCSFSAAVVYLAPCISQTPYITQDLLSQHDATVIPTLAHWDRDSVAYAPLSDTVAESQAFARMRKIVLVEARRAKAVCGAIERVLALNAGRFREAVQVWDWRVLEGDDCDRHETQNVAARDRHFLGMVTFDSAARRTVFVASKGT